MSNRTQPGVPVRTLQFYHLKSNLFANFHPAPAKQFLIILQGTLQLEASNKERRDFPPGSIVLVTDTEKGGKGHVTFVPSEEDVYAAVLPVP